MRRSSLAAGLAAALTLGTSAVMAEGRDYELVEIRRVDAGESVARTLRCGRGEVAVSGGWRFTGIPDDALVWMIHDNYPTDEGGWRFVLQNISDRQQRLRVFLYVFCAEGG